MAKHADKARVAGGSTIWTQAAIDKNTLTQLDPDSTKGEKKWMEKNQHRAEERNRRL